MKAAEILAAFDAEPEAEGQWVGRCPVHKDGNESNPSVALAFSEKRALLAKCRACTATFAELVTGAGLTMADVHDVERIGNTKRAAADVPLTIAARASLMQSAFAYGRALAALPAEHPARAYVAKRFGPLTNAQLQALGLGYDADADRVTFLATNADGGAAYMQKRSLDPNERLRWLGTKNPEDGSRWAAAGFIGHVTGDRTVIITEGPSDGVTVATLDRFDTIAIRGATNGRKILDQREALQGRDVVIMGDPDDAGRAFTNELADTLRGLARTIRIATLEGGDINSMYQDNPGTFADDFDRLVSNAEPAPEPQLEFDITPHLKGADADRAQALADFIKAEGHDVAWTPAFGWLYWDGYCWTAEAEHQIRQASHRLGALVRDVYGSRAAGEAYKAVSGTDQKPDLTRADHLRRLGTRFLSTSGIEASFKELVALPGVSMDSDRFDADKDVIAVGNGLLDLRTGKLREVRASDYITKRLDTAYHPDAKAPRWLRFLSEVFITADGQPDADLQRYIQALIGYGITGHTTEEIFVILSGSGSNGKSKFLEALQTVFGPHVKTTPFATFEAKPTGGIPNDLAALKGARLVMAHEANGTQMAEATLKAITGNDEITARFLRREFFSFRPHFLLFLTANRLPEFVGQDDGLWRRVKLVRFNAQFRGKKAEHGLPEALAAEAEGILAWAVAGAMRWYAANRRLPECKAVDAASAQYRQDADPLGDFLAMHVERTGNRRDVAYYADIRTRYLIYAESVGERHVTGQKRFNLMLDERIGPRVGMNGDGGTAYPAHVRGVKLRSEAEVALRLAKTQREIAGLAGEPTAEDVDNARLALPLIPAPETAIKHAQKRFGKPFDTSGYRLFGGEPPDGDAVESPRT